MAKAVTPNDEQQEHSGESHSVSTLSLDRRASEYCATKDRSISSWASRETGWAEILRSGLELLFPHRCPLCEQATVSGLYTRFCDECVQTLRSDESELCATCGAPAAMSVVVHDECAQCRGKRFMFERAIPFGLYRGRLRDVVVQMKEPHAASLAASVGREMAIQARLFLGADMPELVLGTPMHWRRRWSRRVNNAERLAMAFAREAGLPMANRLVIGTRVTRKQSLLSVNQRRENVRGAFRISKTADLDGRHVGLVDDTMTTGATADEISRVLLRAGAARVTLFLAARGVSN